MHFQLIPPAVKLSRWIECYWVIESESVLPVRQKIVPDGFPELIFHFGDPYQINISGAWQRQAKSLFAGQLRRFFFLENEGRSEIFGIKFKPAAPALLFGVDMSGFTDRVVDLHSLQLGNTKELEHALARARGSEDRVLLTEQFLQRFCDREPHPVEQSVMAIIHSNGVKSVEELADEIHIGTRQLELYFKKYVGLSPKFYSRIIRFSRIFEYVKGEKVDWSDVVHLAGYYDQAHFIKNFKAFTGEEPGRYGFDKKDLANFFMKKEP